MDIIAFMLIFCSVLTVIMALLPTRKVLILKYNIMDYEMLDRIKVIAAKRQKQYIVMAFVAPIFLNLITPCLIKSSIQIPFNSIIPFLEDSTILNVYLAVEFLFVTLCVCKFIKYRKILGIVRSEISIRK
jgi:hypothetical protein